MWIFGCKGSTGFSANSTAEQVTKGVDGSGLTAIVTGATSGIGEETARVLALRGVHVVLAVRNVESGNKVKEAIIEKIPGAKVDVMKVDISSFESVRQFAAEYNKSGLPLNILVNNAGIMGNAFELTKDNIESQFATNHLGPFLLTNLLLDNMKRTAGDCQREGRIVNVASEIHRNSYKEGIIFDKINDSASYGPLMAYGQSKLANMLHVNELTRRCKEEGVPIIANSLHPGLIPTSIMRKHGWVDVLLNNFLKFILKTIPQGAATSCYLALNPQVEGLSGKYFVDCNLGKPSAQSEDPELARKLWEVSLKMTGSN